MLNKLKTYLTLISIFIAILSGLYGIYSGIKANKFKAERDNAKDELLVKTTEVITYKNKLGQEVTKTIEYEKSLSQLKNSNDSIEQLLYKTIKASDYKTKQLNDATFINQTTSNTGVFDDVKISPNVYQPEPIKIRHFEDGYLDLIVKGDSVNYTYDDTLIVISGKRLIDRKFFLWRLIGWKKVIDKNMVEITSTNPNSKIKLQKVKINN